MSSMLTGPANLALTDIGIIVHILLYWVLGIERVKGGSPDHLPKAFMLEWTDRPRSEQSRGTKHQ